MRRYLLVTFAIAALLCFVAALSRIANVRAEGASATSASRPIAKRFPRSFVAQGRQRTDDYDWLRNSNDPQVMAYLAAENAYADQRLSAIRAAIDRHGLKSSC